MYPVIKKFFCRAWFISTWNIFKHKYTSVCTKRAMIILPCFLIFLFFTACNEAPKNFNGSCLRREITFENGINLVYSLPLTQAILCKSRGKNGSQLVSSNNFIVFLRDCKCETISNPRTQKSSGNKESSRDVNNLSRVQFYLYSFLGACIGAIISAFIIPPFVRFLDWWYTQRFASPAPKANNNLGKCNF